MIIQQSSQKNTRGRLFLLLGAGLVLMVIGIAWRLAATDSISQWRAEKMSDVALAKVAGETNASVPYVMEWAKRLEAGAHFAEAERVYSRAMELAPSKAETWIGFGRTAMLAGDWAKAEAALAKTVEQWPDNATAHFTYATILSGTFQIGKAIEQVKLGLKSEPTKGEAYQTLGDLELRAGDGAAAAEAYEQAMKLLPDAKGLKSRYGAALVSAGKYEKAQKVLELALKEDPSDINARFSMGTALAHSGKESDRPRALLELSRVVEFSENKSRAYIEASRMWLVQGDRGNAIQGLEHAFDLNPYNVDMLEMLSKAYKDVGRPAEAEKVSKALDTARNLTDQRNKILSRLDAGEDVVTNLIQLGRLDKRVYNKPEAQSALQAASLLDPNNAAAKRELKLLNAADAPKSK